MDIRLVDLAVRQVLLFSMRKDREEAAQLRGFVLGRHKGQLAAAAARRAGKRGSL